VGKRDLNDRTPSSVDAIISCRKAVILAGGLGTRISEETHLKPKPMIEIGGKPILWHVMKIYSAHGVNDFIICCGYKGYVIKEYFANYFLHMSDITFDMVNNKMEVHQQHVEPWRVTLVDTGDETMTGGRLKRVAPTLQARRPSASPMVTAWAMWTSAPWLTSTARTANSPRSPPRTHQAALARWSLDGDQIASFKEKPHGRRQLDQRRFLRAVTQGHRPHRRRCHDLGARPHGKPCP
jgi:glucose-1-phosphate cytidylyltransferase